MNSGLSVDNIIVFIIVILALILIAYDKRGRQNSLDTVLKGKEISTKDFLKLMKKDFWSSEKRPKYRKYDVPGVYVLFNKTKEKYLIGQSAAAMSMVNQHLTGHGNVVFCADWMSGDEVTIRIIDLAGSGYFSLDDLQATVEEPYKEEGFGNYDAIVQAQDEADEKPQVEAVDPVQDEANEKPQATAADPVQDEADEKAE